MNRPIASTRSTGARGAWGALRGPTRSREVEERHGCAGALPSAGGLGALRGPPCRESNTRVAFVPVGGLLVGVAHAQHGGLVERASRALDRVRQASGGEAAGHRQRGKPGEFELAGLTMGA